MFSVVKFSKGFVIFFLIFMFDLLVGSAIRFFSCVPTNQYNSNQPSLMYQGIIILELVYLLAGSFFHRLSANRCACLECH